MDDKAKIIVREQEQDYSSEFRKDLEDLINRHSMENGSDTPDFILADYLLSCLIRFDSAVRQREKWYKPKE